MLTRFKREENLVFPLFFEYSSKSSAVFLPNRKKFLLENCGISGMNFSVSKTE
jgi:hypothetical protein